MRKILFVLLASLPLTSFSQNVVTDLVRFPIFCDVAGHYQGTYAGGTWTATIDSYTGLANLSIQNKTQHVFGTGSVRRIDNHAVFLFDFQDGTAWRGSFTQDGNELSGHSIDFESMGAFSAKRDQLPRGCKQ